MQPNVFEEVFRDAVAFGGWAQVPLSGSYAALEGQLGDTEGSQGADCRQSPSEGIRDQRSGLRFSRPAPRVSDSETLTPPARPPAAIEARRDPESHQSSGANYELK